jgi:hypothetical protein
MLVLGREWTFLDRLLWQEEQGNRKYHLLNWKLCVPKRFRWSKGFEFGHYEHLLTVQMVMETLD